MHGVRQERMALVSAVTGLTTGVATSERKAVRAAMTVLSSYLK